MDKNICNQLLSTYLYPSLFWTDLIKFIKSNVIISIEYKIKPETSIIVSGIFYILAGED